MYEGDDPDFRKAQRCIVPDYHPLAEEQMLGGFPPSNDPAIAQLQWVDIYLYHSEYELAWDMLFETPTDIENNCLEVLEKIGIDFGWPERAESVRRFFIN